MSVQKFTEESLIRELKKCRGNIRKTAHFLGVTRMCIYKNVRKYGLWPIVNAERRKRLANDQSENRLLENARNVLRGSAK